MEQNRRYLTPEEKRRIAQSQGTGKARESREAGAGRDAVARQPQAQRMVNVDRRAGSQASASSAARRSQASSQSPQPSRTRTAASSRSPRGSSVRQAGSSSAAGSSSPRPSRADAQSQNASRREVRRRDADSRSARAYDSRGESSPDQRGFSKREEAHGGRRSSRDVARAPFKPSAQPKPNVAGASDVAKSIALRVFAGIMALGCVIGLLFFLRPTTSDLEKRELTPFPEVKVETILNGEFFSDLSLWYSDTYPLRELLVSADKALEGLFGIQPDQQLVGADQSADQLPSGGEESDLDLESRQSVEAPTEQAMAEDIQANIMGRLYVEDGAAYSVYYFSKESVQQYAAAISIAAQRLEGTADVYSLIVPNNSAVMLDEKTLSDLGGSDQSQAIDYFYSLYDPLVHTVKVLDVLRANNSDYVYFRSDHHWTADGAYLAYRQFCERKGIEPVDKNTLQTTVFQPFLGTYYSQLDLDAMADNPDYVTAYYPNGTNDLTYWNEAGEEVDANVIQDVTGWNESSLYNTFICGDQPETHIHNPEITDGSSILLVKDSFGTAFAPWLVNSYQDVWVIDFRYTSENIVDFVKDHGIQDVLFLNNIEIAGTTSVANMLTSEVTDSSAGQ